MLAGDGDGAFLDTVDTRKGALDKRSKEVNPVRRFVEDNWDVLWSIAKVVFFYLFFASMFRKTYKWNVSAAAATFAIWNKVIAYNCCVCQLYKPY